MSYQDFKEAMKTAPQCEDYERGKGISSWNMHKAEKLLGIRFSKQCREFYKKYNYMAFCGYELDGINPNSSFPIAGNAVATALDYRKKWGLPEKWMPICFLDDGYYACLDYSHLNAAGEPRVIETVYADGTYQISSVMAEDLGEFLQILVDEALADQVFAQQNGMLEIPKDSPLHQMDKKLKSIDDELAEVDRLLAELRKLQAENTSNNK